jgi:hypothetical protein
MQCIENESEHIILPELTSVSATIVSTSEFGHERIFEIKGKYKDGQYPIKDIKWATGFQLYSLHDSVDFLDLNTFEVEFYTWQTQGFEMVFYFISENNATYSDKYLFTVAGNEVRVTKLFP